MTLLRTCAEFTCDLPTGQVEIDGEFTRLGGEPVALALAEMLTRIGCEPEPVEDAGDHGWAFHFRYRKLRLWCQVTLISGYLAIFEDLSSRGRLLGGEHPDLVELMRALGDALATDTRFHEIGWFHRDEVLSETVGATRPSGAFDSAPCLRRQIVEATPVAEPPAAQVAGGGASAPSRVAAPAQTYALRRFIARTFDVYVVGGLLFECALHIGTRIGRGLGAGPEWRLSLPHDPTIGAFALIFGSGFAAGAVPLALTGTSLGKGLFGLRVARDDGRAIGWRSALAREAWAFTFGYGLGAPVLNLYAAFMTYRFLPPDGVAKWDQHRGRRVTRCKRPLAAQLAAAGAVIALYLVQR